MTVEILTLNTVFCVSNRINVVFQLMDYELFLLWPAVLMYELPFFQVATQKMYSLGYFSLHG